MKSIATRHLVAGGVVLGLLFFCRGSLTRDTTERSLEFFPDMARSPARKPYEPSASFPGGLVQQRLPEGVALYGASLFEYGPGDEEAARAGRELTNPFAPSDAAALERGARVYKVFCALCHGNDGAERTPVVERGMIPPPSLTGARAVGMKDGELFHLISHGRGSMASYAVQLEPDDRWRAVLHVRALQKGVAK
jgi:mono/diheme cytochrome c family protein